MNNILNSDQLQKHQIKCKLKLSLSRTHEHMKNELYTDKNDQHITSPYFLLQFLIKLEDKEKNNTHCTDQLEKHQTK